MTRTFHLSLSIRGALRNRSFKGFTDEHGLPMTPRQAEANLKLLLAKGHEKLPLGDCPNFDIKTGCPGHTCDG